ncbi:MAG: 2-C-methyl-D-erythritol 4-phosphate cytidylyltransferase [Nanoarchaeota archaeon]
MNFAIIVAAGKGKRMNSNTNKVFLEINNKPILAHTLEKFQSCSAIDEIAVVSQKINFKKINEIKKQHTLGKIKNIVEGGKERQDSVYNGLMSIKKAKSRDIILVHNGSNPLVKDEEIKNCIAAAKKHGASAAAFRLKDTIKRTKGNFASETISRKDVWQMQTPQCIQYGLFTEAYKNARNKKIIATDDVSLVEALNKKVKIVECSYENFKITTPNDFAMAKKIMSDFRIGFGQDSHHFTSNKNKKLVLGGYKINEPGFEANSDGDIILHALFNAISSAIGERGLGYYADSMFKKGITDSKKYLEAILEKMKQKNLSINNISIMIEAGKPKLEPHTEKIKSSLSKILGLNEGKIGISYTSGERLSSFGLGKGMQCFVTVSLS